MQDGSVRSWGTYLSGEPSSTEKDFYSVYGSSPDIDERCQFNITAQAPQTTVKAEHDQQGVYFCPETVELVAYQKADGSVDTDFTGQVQLQVDDSAGTWQALSADGLSDISQGTLTYTFAASDLGRASFQWLYNGSSSDLGLALSSPDSSIEIEAPTSLNYADIGFRWKTSNTEHTYKAGNSIPLTLEAINSDHTRSSCAVVEAYQPGGDMRFSVSYQISAMKVKPLQLLRADDSTLGSTLDTLDANIHFTLGQANLKLVYEDVGQMQLSVQDPQRPAMQATYHFTSRPHHLNLSLSNPSPISGSGFAHAGAPVKATLQGYSKNNLLLPSFGLEQIAPSRATLSASLQTPTTADGAVLGSLQGQVLSHGGMGTLQSNDLRYGEVGSIELSVSALQGPYATFLDDYQSDSDSTLALSSGRFVPYKLQVTPAARGKLKAACGHYQYIGQPLEWDIVPELAVSAHTQAGQLLKNYGLAHTPLQSSDFGFELPTLDPTANVSVSMTGLSVASPLRVASTLHFSLSGQFEYARNQAAERSPFATDLSLTLKTLVDMDGAAISSSLRLSPENQILMRFGRVRLLSGFNQWQNPQPLEAFAEYYDGQQYQLADSGQCATIINLSAIDLDNPNPETFSTQWISQLDYPAHLSRGFSHDASLRYQPTAFSPLGEPVQIRVTANVPLYLTYPWHGWPNGTFSDPEATLSFGVYGGVSDIPQGGSLFLLEIF